MKTKLVTRYEPLNSDMWNIIPASNQNFKVLAATIDKDGNVLLFYQTVIREDGERSIVGHEYEFYLVGIHDKVPENSFYVTSAIDYSCVIHVYQKR